MNFYKTVDKILEQIHQKYEIEFRNNNFEIVTDNQFIIYTSYELPMAFAENAETETIFNLTLNLYIKSYDLKLINEIKNNFKQNNFYYIGGGEIAKATDFPNLNSYYLEFKYIDENNTEE